MTKIQIRPLIVNVVLLLAFNILAFAIPFARTSMFWVSYSFGMLSILCQVPVTAIAFKDNADAKSRFYGFPIFNIALLYLVAQLVLSLVGMIIAVWVPAWVGMAVFIPLLVAAVIGFISTDAARDELEQQDIKTKRDVSRIRALQSWSAGLISQAEDPDVRREVERLAEALRYSDPVSSDILFDVENDLTNCMDELSRSISENNKRRSLDICKKASALVTERNRLCKLKK